MASWCGSGPVRTGVTAILPRGKSDTVPVFEGYFSQTGTAWIEESGFAEEPVLLTNTHSVGLARDALVKWELEQADRSSKAPALWSLQIVAETWDGYLSDINGFHVKEQDVFHALDTARGGGVEEGSVGGGTGMVCYGFKGGIGTSSRKLDAAVGGFTVGVLVQCDCGRRPLLRIAGAPVGQEITENIPYARNAPWCR